MHRSRPLTLIALIFFTGSLSLNAADTEKTGRKESTDTAKTIRPSQQFKLKSVPKYPNVGLTEYVLISDDVDRDRTDAEAVIQTKVELVRAMQTKLREHFEPTLARDFIFHAKDSFLDRNGYIDNRVGDPVKVKQADYLNVVVRFMGNIALVTYSNIVESQPGPGAHEANYIWTDILSKEGGRWKFSEMHLIESRRLTTSKQ